MPKFILKLYFYFFCVNSTNTLEQMFNYLQKWCETRTQNERIFFPWGLYPPWHIITKCWKIWKINTLQTINSEKGKTSGFYLNIAKKDITAPNNLMILKHRLIVNSTNSNSAPLVLWCGNYQIDLTTNKLAYSENHHTYLYHIKRLRTKFAWGESAKHKQLLFWLLQT